MDRDRDNERAHAHTEQHQGDEGDAASAYAPRWEMVEDRTPAQIARDGDMDAPIPFVLVRAAGVP